MFARLTEPKSSGEVFFGLLGLRPRESIRPQVRLLDLPTENLTRVAFLGYDLPASEGFADQEKISKQCSNMN